MCSKIYFLSKKASYTIIKIAIAIKINTGNTSQKPIIDDLVNVVARPIKNAVANYLEKDKDIQYPTLVRIYN